MKRIALLLTVVWILSAGVARADVIYNVSLDTALLNVPGHPEAPFLINFQLVDGGTPGTNTVVLSNFAFGAGGPDGVPVYNGGASGDLSSSVTLNDTDFFNDILQGFIPGDVLEFTLKFSTNVDPISPDVFTFAITNSTFTFFDVFIQIDLDSTNPTVQTFASGAFSPIGLPAPIVTPAAAVPEPATWVLFASALSLLGLGVRKK